MEKKICSFLIMLLILAAMPLYFGTGALSVYAAGNVKNDTLRVAQYNILGNVIMDRNYVWNDIKDHDPDLIALNEVDVRCFDDVVGMLGKKGYDYYGNSDWSPDSNEYIISKAGWYNLTIFKKDKFELLDSGMFTLSDTPDVDYSFISYMDLTTKQRKEGRPRTCSWVYLKNKETGGKLIFSSVHVQHAKTSEHDYNSIGLTVLGEQLSILADDYNCEVICAGDVNSSDPVEVYDFGFSSLNKGQNSHAHAGSIDTVLITDGIIGESFSVGKRTSSDHCPTFSVLKVPVTKSLTDSEIMWIVIIIAAVVVVATVITVIVILTKRKKERNKKAAEERLAEMRAKLAEYEKEKINEKSI
ncbi:MAG: hypothetical protein E7384_07430 [Ruminococcaceae bacterium]|nr:hypothetical protein [Oscillospiraceae bacterium]